MRRRARSRLSAALVAVGVGLLLTSVAGATASAQETGEPAAEIGFFDVAADATGIGASFGDPASQPYPVAAGMLPSAYAQLSAGPSGQARSSLLWPGPLLGNAGSLANVIGTPLPPEVVSNANYPIVAHASSAAGGSDEATLGPMHAKVEGGDSRASTTLTDVDVPDVVTATRVRTSSRSYLDGATAVSVAESVLEGVQVAGVLEIARIRTVATGTTDGVAATTAQEVTVTGVRLGDQSATIDGEGLHLGGGTVPVGEALAGAQPAFDGFGIRAFVTDPLKQETSGGAAVLDSGSVVIEWSPPQSGQFFTVVLGGSSVRVSATPGSAFGAPGSDALGDVAPAPDATTALLPTPALSLAPPDAPAAASNGSATAPAGGERAGAPVAAPVQSGAALDLAASTSDRVPFGWVLVGMVGAALAGTGLHSFRQQALVAVTAGSTCPLERS